MLPLGLCGIQYSFLKLTKQLIDYAENNVSFFDDIDQPPCSYVSKLSVLILLCPVLTGSSHILKFICLLHKFLHYSTPHTE